MAEEMILNAYMDMEPDDFFLSPGQYSLELLLRSYCFSQYRMIAQQTGDLEAMKWLLSCFQMPCEIPHFREAVKSELNLLTLWMEHMIRLYEDFFCVSEEKKTIYFWRQYRNYEELKRFIDSETDSIMSAYHQDTCLKPMAELLTRIGREILTEERLNEALEEEKLYGISAFDQMKTSLTELMLWKGEEKITFLQGALEGE